MSILRNLFFRVMEQAQADGGDAGGAEGETSNSGDDSADEGADRAEIETRARSMGWSPKENWRGDQSNWIDAPEFVRRGEQVMPILRANLRNSESQIAALMKQNAETTAQLKAATESIQVLTNLSTEQTRKAAKERRKELLIQQATARSEGNVELEVDLGEQISDLTTEIKTAEVQAKAAPAAKKTETPPPAVDDPTKDPEYVAWTKDNPWFGTDRKRTALATAVGEEIRSDPANAGLTGRAFFDMVTREVNKIFTPARATSSKVEGGGGVASGGSQVRDAATGKSYADLPQEAKDACERQAKWVVGEGRAFKDLTAWRKHYITTYFNS